MWGANTTTLSGLIENNLWANQYYPHSTSIIQKTDKTHDFDLKSHGFCQVSFSPFWVKEKVVETGNFHTSFAC